MTDKRNAQTSRKMQVDTLLVAAVPEALALAGRFCSSSLQIRILALETLDGVREYIALATNEEFMAEKQLRRIIFTFMYQMVRDRHLTIPHDRPML